MSCRKTRLRNTPSPSPPITIRVSREEGYATALRTKTEEEKVNMLYSSVRGGGVAFTRGGIGPMKSVWQLRKRGVCAVVGRVYGCALFGVGINGVCSLSPAL